MDRFARTVVVAAAGVVVAACGEPFIVLGDAPGIMRVVLGVGDSIGTQVDSSAVRTRLTGPTGVAFDAESSLLFVGDRGSVRQVSGITTPVARLFSVTSRGRATLLVNTGGCAAGGPCMLQPTAMAIAPDGSLLIADQLGHRVFRYAPSGVLSVIAGDGTSATAPDGAPAATSPMSRPAGVAVDAGGSIYIAESGGHRVRRIDSDGLLRTVAGTGEPGHSGDDGPATAAQLHEPAGLALHDDVLYVSDMFTHVIRRVDVTGVISTIAGVPGGAGYGGDGGAAVDAIFNRPVALALTPDGRLLFVSDQGNDRVRAIDLINGSIRTFAGTGTRTWTGSRRLAGETSLFRPVGLDASANGFLFIVDSGHSVVWRTSVGTD
jgi:DNA-binding beta-propeller fold protein YncE